MKKVFILFSTIVTLLLFGVQCTFLENYKSKKEKEEPYILDLNGIQNRGFIRAAVDNNSTGYYIYRGRRMGYEFELLRDLAKRLDVQLHLVLVSDIEKAFDYLASGQVDVIAFNLEESEERKEKAAFSIPLGKMNTVLVGNKNTPKIQAWEDLGTDTIYVREGAIYKSQLCAMKDSLQLDYTIFPTPDHEETLIDRVADGEIKWTIADQNIAQANATYYGDLNISWKVERDGEVSWVVRKNSTKLLSALNNWLEDKQKRFIPDLYAKYFLNSKNSYFRNTSPFSSLAGNQISVYDDIIKGGAAQLGWDWRLLASLVYKESRFDTVATSYAGAKGLLQLMPVTLERFGVTNPNDPQQSLMGGVRYLRYLDKFWLGRVPETSERIKFILASYNIGHGHVEDAWKLALKFGENTQSWESVSKYLELKSDPSYYTDPIVKSGYAKGHLAVNYVEDVMSVFDSYKALVEP
ncbi:transporter substrate-binding domain-containing protein [Algoriphagus halophytocola]|uniref:Transporter substrate-binding domain-containing protein n=1 Tax=Algoriphagus halophytocola TaxID=2991499 RepID=A0ABY6MI38_9BACT|nr:MULTISPECIES: transporter substrate-binding domain-containing protein [unclassified Algoriphagus]UZD21849.1 transporter substrate-binding domain-containing protein [Algoriphagus sp. TR-M5]WBL43063.1 transporter substrate-binding domain-containing protein [Algoriphagus sp. TR-M9]